MNWRQLDTGKPYVRFSGLMSMLSEAVDLLVVFLDDEKLGSIKPDQVELTYVNHIHVGEKGSAREPLSRYISCWRSEPASWKHGTAEEASFRTQYVLTREGGVSARVFVELDSGYTVSSRTPIYVMNLIARGAPDNPTVESALSFFDEAHQWIVNGFTSLTTDEAHTQWGRRA